MKIGVIVGRFQVPKLHRGHKWLVNTALSECDKVMIYIGSVDKAFTSRNPFPEYIVEQAIRSAFPTERLSVWSIYDTHSDEQWVETLDAKISSHSEPGDEIVMYGSRDSFIEIYRMNGGKHRVSEVEAIPEVSGTDVRKDMRTCIVNSEDFRMGIVYAVQNMQK